MAEKLSYTGRDVAEIRRTLVDMVPTLTTKWTDFSESDLGMIIIELIAAAQDKQNFYFDRQTFETYLDTAVQDKNIRSLIRNMNYRIPLTYSARGVLRIEFEDSSYKEIKIPKYTKVFSSVYSTVLYSVLEAVDLRGEFSFIDIPVIEGDVRTLSMTRDDFENNVNVSGNISRRIYLGYQNVADGSVQIEQNNYLWAECDDALMKYEGGRYYSVHKDSDGQVYILMPVNFLDLIPQTSEGTVTITYIISSGLKGLIEAEVLDSIEVGLSGAVYIGNPEATYGAADEPNLQSLKLLARRNARTMDRFITLDDYKTGVDTEPYVFQSVVKDWKYKEFVTDPYLVKIWAVDHSGNSLGSENIKTLEKKLYEKGDIEVTVEVKTTEIISYDIVVDIIVNSRSYEEREKVRQQVQSELEEYYKLENMSYGQNISYSLLASRVRAVSPLIADVWVKSPSADVLVGEIQFPKMNSITVNQVFSFES